MNINAIILCVVLVALIANLIIFRNTMFVKKYWRYSLILIPAILIIIIKLFATTKKPTPGSSQEAENLGATISAVKDQLQEAHMTTAVEVTAIKAKDQAKLEELKKVTQEKI